MKAKNLAEEAKVDLGAGDDWCAPSLTELPAVVLPECPCEFTNLPGLGSGLNNGYRQEAQALQG